MKAKNMTGEIGGVIGAEKPGHFIVPGSITFLIPVPFPPKKSSPLHSTQTLPLSVILSNCSSSPFHPFPAGRSFCGRERSKKTLPFPLLFSCANFALPSFPLFFLLLFSPPKKKRAGWKFPSLMRPPPPLFFSSFSPFP